MAKQDQVEEVAETPIYRVTETSFINDRLVEAGTEVAFDHDPGFNLVPVNDAAKARVKSFREQANQDNRSLAGPNDPAFAYGMVRTAVQDGTAQGAGRAPGS